MEFEFLIEDGEFFVEDAEVERLMEALELSEDEVMDLISEALSEVDLSEAGGKYGFGSQKAAMEAGIGKAQHDLIEKQLGDNVSMRPGDAVGTSAPSSYLSNKTGQTTQTIGNTPKPAKGVIKGKLAKAGKAISKAAGTVTNYAKEHPGKTTAIAAGALGVAGLGAAGAYALKKRKAKKAEEDAKKAEDVMIDILIREDALYISEEDMDFLLEACDYELTQNEILENISEAGGKYGFGSQKAKVLPYNTELKDGIKEIAGRPSDMVGNAAISRKTKNALGQAPVQTKPQGHVATKEELERVERLKAGMDPKNGKAKLGMMTNAKRGLKKAGKYVQEHPGKSALAAGAVLGSIAGGAYLLKKRKAKKEADKEAQSLKECMIDILLDEEENILYVENQDIDFLLEACDYELSEAEILDNIWAELCEGKYTFNGKNLPSAEEIMAKQPEIKKVSDVGKMSQELVDKAGLPSSKPREQNLDNRFMSNFDEKTAERAKDQLVKDTKEQLKKEKKEINKAKRAEISAKLKEKMGKAGEFVSDHKKQIGIGAAVAGGALATGLVAHHVLKKRKAKKEADKKARNLKECMIDLVQEGEYIYISESDMDFLLEACDYSLTEDEILMNLAEAKEVDEYFPGDGIVAVTSDKIMAEVIEKQQVDMDEEHCDNGMMADCSVAPDTKQKIKKPKCMHESYDYDEYSESFEGDHLINEAILSDCNIELTEDEMFDLISENLLSERSIVRLDKQAKRSQAEAKALIVIAREQNDPLYKKLVKVYKQKQAILAQLDSKYGSRAIARVRKNAGKMNVDK